MPLTLLTDFDGACPYDKRRVKRMGKSEFVVQPGHVRRRGVSEEAPGGGARMDVRLVNDGDRPARLTLHADWDKAATPRMHMRDTGYLRHESEAEWTLVLPQRSGLRVTYDLEVRPGMSELGLWPAYNTETCARFAASLRSRKGVTVRTSEAGKSEKGRPIHLIDVRDRGRKADREQVVVQARDHAYETAGSYCVEGMVDYLLSDDPVAVYFLRRFRFAFLPMTNVDGVHDGMSRLTSLEGADLNRCRLQDDGAWRTIKATLDRFRPNVYINIHNWQSKWIDGLLCNSDVLMARIRERMPDQRQFLKRWREQSHADFLNETGLATTPPSAKSWKNYVAENFGAQGVTFEFPWFGRDAAAMRETGRQTLRAALAGYLDMRGG